jgi:hypothetical protein
MKYIFLDIDGVLNAPGDKNLIDGVIEYYKLELLKLLISKTNSKVVIISSRRIYKDDRDSLLKALDDIYNDLSFISFNMNYKYRKDEINYFLSNNPCEGYVILDDVDSNYTKDCIMINHFIHINGMKGLTIDDYNKALDILNDIISL